MQALWKHAIKSAKNVNTFKHTRENVDYKSNMEKYKDSDDTIDTIILLEFGKWS